MNFNRTLAVKIKALAVVVLFAIFLMRCSKKDASPPPPQTSDTTFIYEPTDDLSDDEYNIFLQLEDTTSIPINDLRLPNGDTLVNYLSNDFLTVYPLSISKQTKNSIYKVNSIGNFNNQAGYQAKIDQLKKYETLLSTITGKAQFLIKKGNPYLYPDEGPGKPAQNKIGYSIGSVYAKKDGKFLLDSKGEKIVIRLYGKDYRIREGTEVCPNAIHALDCSGFISEIFKVDGITDFPAGTSEQGNLGKLINSMKGILDINRFEFVDVGANISKDKFMAGDLIEFYYNGHVTPSHIGLIGKGDKPRQLQFYHSFGNSKTCSRNSGLDNLTRAPNDKSNGLKGGPLAWNLSDITPAKLVGDSGTMIYSIKRLRYIAELEAIPSTIDNNVGATNTIQVKVYSSDGIPVDNIQVEFATSDGSVIKKSPIVGVASSSWTITNMSGVQTCTATVRSPVDHNTILDQVIFTTSKGQQMTLPSLTTTIASSISSTSATTGGNISNDGGSSITSRGVVWNTAHNPQINNGHVIPDNGQGTGSFSSILTNLLPSTNYYVSAYATNGAGTNYGTEIPFTTLQSSDDSCLITWIWGPPPRGTGFYGVYDNNYPNTTFMEPIYDSEVLCNDPTTAQQIEIGIKFKLKRGEQYTGRAFWHLTPGTCVGIVDSLVITDPKVFSCP